MYNYTICKYYLFCFLPFLFRFAPPALLLLLIFSPFLILSICFCFTSFSFSFSSFLFLSLNSFFRIRNASHLSQKFSHCARLSLCSPSLFITRFYQSYILFGVKATHEWRTPDTFVLL